MLKHNLRAWCFACLVFVGGLYAMGEPLPDEFTVRGGGPRWQAEMAIAPDGQGGLQAAIVASFPGDARSEPGQFVAVGVEVDIPESGSAELSFGFADTFAGPTAGYHFAEVLVGETVTIYGHEWLCPSTGALPATIDYTRRIVERYEADAVMLDNNEFFSTPSGLTCHCAGCRSGFREYLKLRFGETAFGRPCDEMEIPTEAGPLYGLWLHWRNRVWAEATERFRVELRKVKPGIVVLANTQYLRSSPDLATDLQYGHEDAVLSESRNKTLHQMVDKLLLGRALAKDRPLWNYLGTFHGGDYGLMVSPEEVSMNVSTALACRARPWVVYYGFFEKPGENGPSLERMSKTLKWHVANEGEFRGLKPYSPVLSLVSPTSRNLRGTSLIPSHLTPLRKTGFCVRLVDERALPDGAPDDCRVLLIETAPCMSRESIAAVAAFVQNGGRLIASVDTGLYDEIGRPRPRSPLWSELGLSGAPVEPTPCGKGQILATSLAGVTDDVVRWLEPARVTLKPAADAAILPYVNVAPSI